MSSSVIISWVLVLLSLGFSSFLFYEYSLEWRTTDPYSYANTMAVTTTHYDLRLELDFDNHIITGEQKIHMKSKSYILSEVILDIDNLDVTQILYNDDTPVNFKITRTRPEIGQALEINIPFQVLPSSEFTLTLFYKTSSEAAALSWLFANQTEGNTLPYMFSLCETTHCRSIAPFQDSPAIKSTFTTHVVSPPDIKVRMSGNLTGEFDYDNNRVTKFESTIPVPSYSLAIVAGDLAEQKIGNKTYVVAEASTVSDYAKKLSEFEQWFAITENYLTDYSWGEYKIVVQPTSFPYAGVENPLLSSISSDLLKGDPSSIQYVIHELAHSWAGNLVTHDSWVNVWIKEGFATFIERKVAQLINGDIYYRIFSQYGNETMHDFINEVGESSPLTSLYPRADSIMHADSILNSVQAEKGFQFLVHAEELIGESLFEEFIVEFIQKFKYQSIDTDDVKDFLIKYIYSKFESRTARDIYIGLDFDNWLVSTGKPKYQVDFSTVEYTDAIALAEDYIIRGGSSRPSNYRDFRSYSVPLKSIFLNHFLKNTTRYVYKFYF